MNAFVDYLNSTNNVGGNATGSLAETQVKSAYFDLVKVDRKLGAFIADTVKNKDYKTFILTGHAGDGKTSVLVQVLKELGLLCAGEGLKDVNDYDHFFYVKDMSEIAEDAQSDMLKKALNAPNKNKSSLLISNTGPLLNTFTRLRKSEYLEKGLTFSEKDIIDLQSLLLTQLDENSDELINIGDHSFYLVNIARVDNVSFATTILKKIIAPNLWSECNNCSCADRCPIKNNVESVSKQFNRVSSFIASYYRFLYENDKRMTIRQMVGQISFALTGNLTCDYIAKHYIKEPFFNYNFANLFFGYIGINEAKDSSQIKGVSQIKLLGLDRIALDVDYRLFVNNDLSFFTQNIAEEIDALRKKHKKHYQVSDESELQKSNENILEAKLRRAIRRFYLIYSTDGNEEKLFNQIFGNCFVLYRDIISSKQPKSTLRLIQSLVFKALYIKNTGFLPDKTELPLTLRRENGVFQNVMLVMGTVSMNDLVIVQSPVNNIFEDTDNKQELYLKVKNERFLLTLPMLSYFDDLVQGSIASNNNPALTHGIAKLDTLLLELFGEELPECEEDCELKVLINTTEGQEIRCFAFDGSKLNILY